jgi:ribonuclease HI
MQPEIIAYTDGACKGNNKASNPKGGWGYFFYYPPDDSMVCEDYGGKQPTTNNEMELMALLKLLENLPEMATEIRTDSMYVMNIFVDPKTPGVMNSGWIRNWKRTGRIDRDVKNSELVKSISKLLDTRKNIYTIFKWVKGHSGDPGNEYVDSLANLGVL